MLTLLPTLVKNTLQGSEGAMTTALAVFSIGIAVGSGLASWLAAGRVILLPTALAGVLLGLFSLDLAADAARFAPLATLGAADLFLHGGGLHAAIDLFGIAVSGGLFIVPVFTAVQVWSDRPSGPATSEPSTSFRRPSWWAGPSSSRCFRRSACRRRCCSA